MLLNKKYIYSKYVGGGVTKIYIHLVRENQTH